jgi:23S rRNA (cytidine1920-2'-O)/16S rRNA (cytidine1409-2'-O)-methyltransferase
MKPKATRKRLDVLLVERGLAESRQKAQAMILAGEVEIDSKRADKAGASTPEDAHIEVHSRLQKYASRGGLKLDGALEEFHVSAMGQVCLDVGASNGGFTDCLLQNGAAKVYAVDVNTDQLAWKLRDDTRVVPIKRNARELVAEHLPEQVDLVVADVSFIAVKKVLPGAVQCAKPGADFLILIKPQFELQRDEVGRGGIVRELELHQKAIESVRQAACSLALECIGVLPSKLLGAEGNQEYFLHAKKTSAIESR